MQNLFSIANYLMSSSSRTIVEKNNTITVYIYSTIISLEHDNAINIAQTSLSLMLTIARRMHFNPPLRIDKKMRYRSFLSFFFVSHTRKWSPKRGTSCAWRNVSLRVVNFKRTRLNGARKSFSPSPAVDVASHDH